MQTVLLVIHLMIAVALCVVVLMQRSEGGALGIGGGGGGFMSGRGAANALTRLTAYLAAAFFVSSIGLTIVANRQMRAGSVFDAPAVGGAPVSGSPAGAPATGGPTPAAPARGGILDKLQPPGSGQAPAPRAPQGQ